MLKFIKKHPWIFIVLFLLVLFPQSLTDQAKLNMRVIITGIGIDYVNDQYQITSQIILPSNGAQSGGINAHISYLTSSGKSISECIQKTSYKLGKITELSHIDFILVGETMRDHNLASSLDYFFRNFKLKQSVTLLACFGEAKEAIHKTSELELGVALSLQKIYLSHENSLSAVSTSYTDFIIDSNAECGISLLDTFIITSDSSSSNSSSQSSESEQSSEQSQSAKENSKINVNTPLIVFKNGLFVGKITNEDAVRGYYIADKKSNMGNIVLTNFSFADAQNANINLRIDRMNKTHKIEFINGKPTHIININIQEAKIDEIAPQTAANANLYLPLSVAMQDAIIQATEARIKELINTTFTHAQQQNIDIFKTANYCKRFHDEKWQNYLQNTDNPQNYVQDISVIVNVKFGQIS